MSDFKFDCPNCGQNIVCDTSNAGMNIPCPTCQTLLTVPKPAASTLVPEVPQGGGKLSISKSAPSHSQPPPGAASAPSTATWGAKPAPAPVRKKKMSGGLVATLVIAGICLVAAAGWFGYGAPKLKEHQEKVAKEQEAKRQAEAEAKRQADEAAAKARKPKPAWTLDLARAEFPDRPAAGKHHGVDFTAETVLFQNGVLTLRQTSGSSRQFLIYVPLKSGEKLEGKSFQISADDTNRPPQVVLNWKSEDPKIPGVQVFKQGYAMKLEFGAVTDGKVPGKIYLSVPDAEQSFVAGNFEIGRQTVPGRPAPTAAPATLQRRRK